VAEVVPAVPEVPDVVALGVPVGGRVIVMSDLHMGQKATTASEGATAELARAVEGLEGPGVVVLAGDCWELLGEPHTDPARGLAAHPRLAGALKRFAEGTDRHVVVLPGNHDGALGWNLPAIRTVRKQLGATVAFAVELTLCTGTGERKVRVEHGHQFDPANAFVDPRDPGETPLGHHVVTDLLPAVNDPKARWLDGIAFMAEPAEAGDLIASRLIYRRVLPRFAWLLVPFVIAGLLGLLDLANGSKLIDRSIVAALTVGLGLCAAVVVGTIGWLLVLAGPLRSVRPDLSGGAAPGNDGPRYAAGERVAEGCAGLITGHTHMPELTDLGAGFYANTGCGGAVIHRRIGRAGLPDAFSVARHVSWVELEAGASLHVRLYVGHQETPSTTLVERLATRPTPVASARPAQMASWPGDDNWPVMGGEWRQRRRVRRIAATLIALAGVLNVASAITPPLRTRLNDINDVFPLAVSQAAAVLTVLAGVALLMLARAVRRGQRNAWLVAVTLLASSALLHVVKGLDFEEGVFAGLGAFWLAAHHLDFKAMSDRGATGRSIRNLLIGGVTAVTAGVVATEAFHGRRPRLPLARAIEAVADRMVGITTIALPRHVDRFLVPTLLATSVGLVVAAGWTLFQPVIAHRLDDRPEEAEAQARRLVAAHGGDTLAFFALRDDKRWFFHGDTLVAYAIHQGVCLVSPDPIGPVAQRRDAWLAFHQFADSHGWPVAVMGAAESWLPIYRASGMRDVYIGDEAVVDVRRFNLDGGRNKGLRQAVNRIAKYGYTIEFHDPATISDELRTGLRGLMSESRRGEMERGFSMTLSRIFDADDAGLLLAVCRAPDGSPAAFCHFVPAAAINGYSLDLMRRSEGDHPNGLTDFVVVRTIEHLRDEGMVGLGLNFSVMRSVLAGERGDKLTLRVQKWLLEKMSESMQIESLWRFNAKFDPDWVARYAVYDAPEYLLSSLVAVARAESFEDIPVLGRLFKPKGEPGASLDPGPDGACEPPSGEPEVPDHEVRPVEAAPEVPAVEPASAAAAATPVATDVAADGAVPAGSPPAASPPAAPTAAAVLAAEPPAAEADPPVSSGRLG